MPAPYFREVLHANDYSAMRKNGFTPSHNGYMQYNNDSDVFMHADRIQGQYSGVFGGDKFHLSVKQGEVPRAFNAREGSYAQTIVLRNEPFFRMMSE